MKPYQAFESVLQCAWLVHRKAGANDEKEDDQKEANQNFHGSRVRYGRLGKVGMNAQFFQQTSQRRAKQAVQDRSKPELLMHRESVVSF